MKRGILVIKDGKMIKQQLQKEAFGDGGTPNWCLLDKELVDFWCLHGLSINVLNTKRLSDIFHLSGRHPQGTSLWIQEMMTGLHPLSMCCKVDMKISAMKWTKSCPG